MKKVCLVATSPFVVNGFLLRHLNALAECYCVSLYVNLGDYPLSPMIDSRIRVVDLPIRRKISPWHDFKTLLLLIRMFRTERFDLVHSITPKAGLLGMLGAALAGVPRRYHTFTGQVWSNKDGVGRYLLKQIDRLIVISASSVFADSHSQCDFLQREGLVASGEIKVLGEGSICGVDPLRFSRNSVVRKEMRVDLAVGDDACVFLFVGRLVRDKGLFDLLHAFVRLADNDANVALWVVGPDEEHLQAELETIAGAQNKLIRWIGLSVVPERFMAAADVLVLPSSREGFGMVIVEAAACGIPSVAYRIDGVSDAVQDGTTGLLVPKGNVDALLDAMCLMLEDSALRSRLGHNAFVRATTEYSADAVTLAWIDFYNGELGPNDARP